eukprot:c14107_g1_i1.p1 GENE.c14107_g1_i1~~c14107_g1_i1.p1  ORF type:complete len:487 (-),score=105.43 c14107_g1_i1:829-2244(-)
MGDTQLEHPLTESLMGSPQVFWELKDEQKDHEFFEKMQRTGINPIRKWKTHGRPPVKLIIYLVLVALTTMQITMFSSTSITYMRASYNSLNYFITGEPDIVDQVYLYDINSTLIHMNRTVQNFYTLVGASVGRYYWVKGEDGMREPIRLTTEAFTVDAKHCPMSSVTQVTHCGVEKRSFDLTPEDPLHGIPLNNTRAFFDSLVRMELNFQLKNVAVFNSFNLCYVWSIKSVYDFSKRGGRIIASWDATKRVCGDGHTYWYMTPMQSQVLVASSIFVFGCISTILTFKSIHRAFSLYSGTKRRLFVNLGSEASYWSTLTLKEKFELLGRFFDVWNIISILGNACNVSSAVLGIMTDLGTAADTSVHRFLTGMGCMLMWINLIRYLEYNDKYYALILTLKNGTPGVIRFTVGAAPMYIGYALFGVIFFGPDTELVSNTRLVVLLLIGPSSYPHKQPNKETVFCERQVLCLEVQ